MTEKDSILEVKGINYISEGERNSKPSNMGFVLSGANFCFPVMIIGTLPVLFGLGWWASFWAITIGLFWALRNPSWISAGAFHGFCHCRSVAFH